MRRYPNPVLAFDTRPNPSTKAFDAADPHVFKEHLDALQKFLNDRLQGDDIGLAEQMLSNLLNSMPMASDEPPPFKGQPKPGGEQAQDAATRRRANDIRERNARSYAQRFPGAARIEFGK